LSDKSVSFRHIKNWVLGIVGLMTILAAISFTVLRVVIKSVPDYTVAIQDMVSKKMDMRVEVESLDAEMDWLVPRLNLLNVKISNNTGEKLFLQADELALSLDWLGSIQTLMPVIGEVILTGVDLKVGFNKQSRLLIQNYMVNDDIDRKIKNAGPGAMSLVVDAIDVSDEIKYIVNNINVKILESNVEFYDERHLHRSKIYKNFNLRLFNNGDEHTIEIKADLPEKYGESIRLIIDVEGDLFDYTNLQGELYLLVNNLHAAPWLDDYWDYLSVTASGDVNAEIWLDWDTDEITGVISHLSLRDVTLNYLNKSVNTWELDKLDASVRWIRGKNGWQYDVRNLNSVRNGRVTTQSSSATLKMMDDIGELNLKADFLRIEGLVYLAGMGRAFLNADIPWLDYIEKHRPSGELEQLDIRLPVDEPEDVEINTLFNGISFVMPESEPSAVSHLQGSVAYQDDRTLLVLDSKNTTLKFKKLFRNSLKLKSLKGALEISHKNHEWNLSTDSLQIDTPHISSVSRAEFRMPDNGEPFLDLTCRFKNGVGKYLGLYLPEKLMGKETVEWLDSSIRKGRVVKGGYQFYGYLKDIPFRGMQGVSLADFDVTGVDVSYLKNWPPITNADAHLRIENDSVLLLSKNARILNSKINQAKIYIDNFVSPTLDIKGKVNANLLDIKRFVTESPLHESVFDYINNLEPAGKGGLDFELFVPLYGDYRVEWGGKLSFSGGELNFKKEKYKLTNFQGAVRFAGDTIESSALKAKLDGKAVDIDIKTVLQEKKPIYNIGLTGNLSISSLLLPAGNVEHYLSGDSDWDVFLKILPASSSAKSRVNINAFSDLLGVKSELPGKLGKQAKEKRPLKMAIDLRSGSYINYEFDFDYGLNKQMQLNLMDKNNQWEISVNDESVKGTALVNRLDEIEVPVKIDLAYLDLNKFFEYAEETDAGSTTGEVQAGEVQTDDAADVIVSSLGISPRDIPSLDLSVRALKWGKFNFNRATLKTQQSKLGMIIKELNLVSSDYTVTAKGNWLSGWNSKNTTKFDAHMVTTNLGRVFKQLELSENLLGAEGNIQFNVNWQGPPYSFNWAKLQGDGSLDLKEGTIKQLEVGAGRLLGLFNFETLLSLDFGNQVSDGFSFDRVKGTFSFSRGNVYTDDFKVESKVADILMNGYLDIENGVVDQKVTVQPHLDSTLSLGTAFVAGPTVGGIVYLFQKLLNAGSLTEYQYSLTGKVSDPKVEVLSVPRLEEEDDDEF